MTGTVLSELLNYVEVLAADADRYNTDPATDIVNLGVYGHAMFIVGEGAGGTGTVKIQVEACSDNAGNNNEAIPFRYRATSGSLEMTGAALTWAAATGYTTIAGANKLVAIEVDSNECPAGKPWVRLQLTEVVDDPCDAHVGCVLGMPRYAEANMPTALS